MPNNIQRANIQGSIQQFEYGWIRYLSGERGKTLAESMKIFARINSLGSQFFDPMKCIYYLINNISYENRCLLIALELKHVAPLNFLRDRLNTKGWILEDIGKIKDKLRIAMGLAPDPIQSLDKNEDYDEKCEEKKPRQIFDGNPLLTLEDKIRIAMGLAPDPIQSLDKNEDYDEKCEEKKPRQIFDGNPVLTLVTEKKFYKKARIVQKEFRENLIKYWNGKCAVTGFEKIELLKASHIKPWKDSKDSNEFERRDKFNGLLLAPGLDSAFDKGFISFNEIDGSMLISEDLSNKNKELLGIVNECSKLSKLDEKHKIYLRYHLSYIYENWKNNKK